MSIACCSNASSSGFGSSSLTSALISTHLRHDLRLGLHPDLRCHLPPYPQAGSLSLEELPVTASTNTGVPESEGRPRLFLARCRVPARAAGAARPALWPLGPDGRTQPTFHQVRGVPRRICPAPTSAQASP